MPVAYLSTGQVEDLVTPGLTKFLCPGLELGH
jgi:hypothetical protein